MERSRKYWERKQQSTMRELRQLNSELRKEKNPEKLKKLNDRVKISLDEWWDCRTALYRHPINGKELRMHDHRDAEELRKQSNLLTQWAKDNQMLLDLPEIVNK